MAPVHLIIWGDPKEEYPEDEEVLLAFEAAEKTPDVHVTKVDDPNPAAIRSALNTAIEDPSSQIVYLSCHGNEVGISFSRRGHQTIAHRELAEWLSAIQLTTDKGDAKWLVFGFCESMNPTVRIERLIPSWVELVAGFAGSPEASEVAQLVAGVIINLDEWVHRVINETGRRLDEGPKDDGATWEETRNSFETAAESVLDDPAMNVLDKNRGSVVIARRNTDTGRWERKKGDQFI